MYHYTYLLQHKTEDKRYIGVRTSKVPPLQDIKYWGSSKHLPKDVKETHVKIILREFTTRKEALEHEILLHEVNNVVLDERYYNKAKQTSTGFDTTGTKFNISEQHKQRISAAKLGVKHSEQRRLNNSNAQKALYANGYINPGTGIKRSEEVKALISKVKKELGCDAGINNNRFSPWFIQEPDGTRYEFHNITKSQKAVEDGFNPAYYQDLTTKSKGIKPIGRGKLKNYIIGNIVEDIVSSAQ